MPERQLIVHPIGLVTQPNKLGVFPDGACSQAKDFIMRAPAKMQQAYTKTAAWTTSIAQRPRLLASTANQLIAVQRSGAGVWSVQWITPSLTSPSVSSAPTIPYTTDDFSQAGRLQAITMRGRTIVNGATKDPIVADYENPSSTAERGFRFCGLPQPYAYAVGASTTAPQGVLANTAVSYAAVLRRNSADGYFIVSRPSLIIRYRTSADHDPIIRCDFGPATSVYTSQVGDVIELYRSQSVPYSGTGVDPGTTLYLVASRALTSTDVSNGYVLITDAALASAVGGPLGGLGRAMYTNPDLGGLTVVHDPPPVAACMAVFRGRAWYANCRVPAELAFSLRRGVGTLSTLTERTNGIGLRLITGTFSSGSNVVTAISATHIAGLAIGQTIFATNGSYSITAVGATTVTLDSNSPTSIVDTSVFIYDTLEIDGQPYTGDAVFYQLFGQEYTQTTSRTIDDLYTTSRDAQIRKLRHTPPATLTVRGSNGDKYDPPIPSFPSSAQTIQPKQLKNYVRYSLDQEPEAVPPTNELFVGTGEIYAMVPTRDALWFFCSVGVGLRRISGTIAPIEGIPDINDDEIDSTLILAGPRAWCVLRDNVYAYTNRGLVEISNSTIRELTTGRLGDLLPGAFWNEAETPFIVADSRTDEIYIIGAHATLNFVYSVRYDCFTTTSQFDAAQTGVLVASSLALIFGYNITTLDELQPDLTASLASGPPILDLQPVFGDRPDLVKQFIDATYIFEAGSSGTVNSRFNGSFGAVESLVAIGNDLRATVGIGADAPAIGPSIAPGLAIVNAGLKLLNGISIRYATLTEQQGAR